MEHGSSGLIASRRTAKQFCDQVARPGELVRFSHESYRKAPVEGEGFFAGRGVKGLVVEERHPVRKGKK